MLQIRHVCKQYQTGKLIQKALDDVSLSFRDSEFVAVLGPSGSGKTTLLNVIGGLDRYDSGNLIINGISTEEYRDRDWDSYRNHTIGFVFQSYNLIPHQTILSNVELALTISGVSRARRKQRAMDALAQVGLADQAEKRPAQLSGGQMQRVAIARALINNPDILLADEPTGALDSDTSLQVMEMLEEVAKDRLVVMVTHNPDLAQAYATRIVQLKDGRICADSDPFEPEKEETGEAVIHANMGRSSMSLHMAVLLSFNNLRTKKARTMLTSFAGSIGIIGIALILAISSGVNSYVDVLEAGMATEYPLEIESAYYDVTAYVSARSGSSSILGTDGEESGNVSDSDAIDITSLIYNIFAGQSSNDLASLKDYLENGGSGIEDYVLDIEYSYGITPQIYQDNAEEVVQVHPDHFFDALGFGSTTSANSIMSSIVNTDVFAQLPESEELYRDSYTVLAGRWPESWNECVMVMDADGGTTDLALYVTGLRDTVEMEDMISQFIGGETVEKPEISETYTYDDFLGTTFKVVNSTDYYSYDSQYQIWTDKTDDDAYMQELVSNGEDLTVVGIVMLNEDEDSGVLSTGFSYLPSLVEHLAGEAAESDIVQQQLADPEINVFTGKAFGEEDTDSEFDLSSLFQMDEDAFQEVFSLDEDTMEDLLADSSSDLMGSLGLNGSSGTSMDLSDLVDLSAIELEIPDLGELSLSELMSAIDITVSGDDLSQLAQDLLEGYQSYAEGNSKADVSQLGDAFLAYLQTEEAQEIMREHLLEIIQSGGGLTVSTEAFQTLITDVLTDFQAYVSEMGYADVSGRSDASGEYTLTEQSDILNEYLLTERAQDILNTWSAANLQFDISGLSISQEQLSSLVTDLTAGYQTYAAFHGDVPDPEQIGTYFTAYLGTEAAKEILVQGLEHIMDEESLEAQISDALQSYMEEAAASAAESLTAQLETQISQAAQQLTAQIGEEIRSEMSRSMSQIGSVLADAVIIDTDALLSAFTVDMGISDLSDILSSLTSSGSTTYENNLAALGYMDFCSPDSISIYSTDFESKDKVIEILDDYNDQMEAAGEDDKVVTFSDSVGSMMSMVTEIVNILSYVLIAFVAISLVVSSIMIGVITYISVLERKQEIGILRAIGASRRNISQVFNAETGIIGFAAGLLGIVLTLILIRPINTMIHNYFGITELSAHLPFGYAVILIFLSVALTLLSGMLPSGKASRSDPVEALRTE
ncbi:MAG: ABC transporter ATP-binding protein/permease [Clostridiales bacterium]|nr:ABC transporter ATP-binding protein/permease [Clostridiales bacterium]